MCLRSRSVLSIRKKLINCDEIIFIVKKKELFALLFTLQYLTIPHIIDYSLQQILTNVQFNELTWILSLGSTNLSLNKNGMQFMKLGQSLTSVINFYKK